MLEVVEKLGLDVSYFSEGDILTSENYKEQSTPVKVVFHAPEKNAFGQFYKIKVVDDQYYTIEFNQKEIQYAFGQLVNNEIGSFQIIRDSAAFHPKNEVLIRFSKPESVAAYYARTLQVRPLRDADILEFSLIEPVTRKGIDILNALIQAYADKSI